MEKHRARNAAYPAILESGPLLLTVRRGRGESQLHTASSSLLYSGASLSGVNAGVRTTAAGRRLIRRIQPLDILGLLAVMRPRYGPNRKPVRYRAQC